MLIIIIEFVENSYNDNFTNYCMNDLNYVSGCELTKQMTTS